MSSRTVFMSAAGDPFVSLLAVKLWRLKWYDEVDEFMICYNNHSQVPKEVVGEFLSVASEDPKVNMIYHPRGIGNGVPITEMTLISKRDLVMLLEDDGFIFGPGAVNKAFQDIESDLCDVVGSPRFSCGEEIGEALKKKYNLDYSGYGDVGPNFWPNFFFCKREDLLKTDLNFASITFRPGQYSEELDHTFGTINHGDTFVWACIQLRALGLRFVNVPQHHASPFEATDKAARIMNWIGEPMKWIHGGSLSSGWGGYLSGRIPDTSTDIAKQEIESRVAFWTIASDVVDGFDSFKSLYREGIENLIVGAGLDRARIHSKIEIYRGLMQL